MTVASKQIAVVFVLAGIEASGQVAFLVCHSQREAHTYGNTLAEKVEI